MPQLRESGRLTIPLEPPRASGPPVVPMTLSAEGLVIQSGIGRSRHLWLIDAETLKVKRRIPIPFMCAVASPALSTAYVVGPGLQVIDLASGKVVRDSRGGITTGVEAVVMGSGPIASLPSTRSRRTCFPSAMKMYFPSGEADGLRRQRKRPLRQQRLPQRRLRCRNRWKR